MKNNFERQSFKSFACTFDKNRIAHYSILKHTERYLPIDA